MQLNIVDEIIIETYGGLEEHNNKVDKKIKELKPEFYSITTDIIITVWQTKIIIMESMKTYIEDLRDNYD